tara:strand:- start:27404 stop:28441 length:1038 start_codon:yes stop_codon:yes gene_type:complete
MKPNTYIFFRNDQQQVQFEFDPADPSCLDHAEFKYFGRVLNHLEPTIQNMGLTIYVTAWTVHELPSYGPNVISCILQDEWGREPKYRDKVGMVFKTCGTTPFNADSYKHGDLSDIISNTLGQGKAFTTDGAGRLGTLISRISNKTIAPVHSIPLGYYAKEESVADIPFTERTNDLFFAGSIQHKKGKRFSIKRPKELARDRMTTALSLLAQNHPDINIKTTITGGFGESIVNANKAYLDNMVNTKICPVPRGANLETFRFYEAIRSGCIIIGEAFPKGWFYDDAPIIRLENWHDIQTIVPELLADQDRMLELHTQTLDWWNNICSEQSLSDHIGDKITSFYKAKP